jgi:SAM-dependent methyltransferase
MIKLAKERLATRADLRVGDSEALPWEDDRFDYVVCVDSFHHYPNPERALTEMHRVRRGDVRMYEWREIISMLHAHGFERAEWCPAGSWALSPPHWPVKRYECRLPRHRVVNSCNSRVR